MAKHLSEDKIENVHKELESLHPCFNFYIFNSYFESTPILGEILAPDTMIHDHLYGQEFWEAKFTFLLLVLAAEEELDGYPMEASNEIS